MKKLLRFYVKTDLYLSKDSTNAVVFKRDQRNALFLSVPPIIYFFDHLFGIFGNAKGFNWTLEQDVEGLIVSILFILTVLFMLSMKQKLTFHIPKQTYYEEVGFFPFAMKKKSGSIEKLSIELVEEKRGIWGHYLVYVVKIVFPSKRRVGFKLFHDLDEAKEFLNFIGDKLHIGERKVNPV